MSINEPRKVATMNYLVPASGTTTGFVVEGIFTDTPSVQDWRMQELDGEPFVPSGAFMDNSQGTGPLRIFIRGTAYSVSCPAGARIAVQYPAPLDQITEVTGDGQASIVFVNFPVLPTSDVPPDFSPVVTPLNAILTELGEINVDTLNILLALRGFDSVGQALPLGFDTWPVANTYTGTFKTQEVRALGADTYTKTFTDDGAGNVAAVSQWVKS